MGKFAFPGWRNHRNVKAIFINNIMHQIPQFLFTSTHGSAAWSVSYWNKCVFIFYFKKSHQSRCTAILPINKQTSWSSRLPVLSQPGVVITSFVAKWFELELIYQRSWAELPPCLTSTSVTSCSYSEGMEVTAEKTGWFLHEGFLSPCQLQLECSYFQRTQDVS